jgi:two-component system, OmpR family, response regulator RegX3
MAILVVEDDADLLDILSFMFRREGHDVIAARDGQTGLQLCAAKHPELVLLDVELPKLNGWEVLKQIRATSSTPVIMLTATSDDAAVVKGLELGADDYIGKPFSPRQLMARVRAVLRRNANGETTTREGPRVVTAGDLRLDPQWRTVQRNDAHIKLTAIEFKLLYELVVHEGQVLTHQRLTDRIWGYEAVDDATLLKGHMRNLRRKLEPQEPNRYLQTVVGVGYSFTSRVPATSSE